MSYNIAYDPRSQYQADGAKYAVTRWVSEWAGQPYFAPVQPWYGPYTLVIGNAKLINRTSVPMHKPGVRGWSGKFTFDENTGIYMECGRALWWRGTKINLYENADFDPSAFDKSPAMMSIELGNVAPLNMIAMENGAFSGVAVDENGNAPDNLDKMILRDQVYGGSLAVLPEASLPAWASSTAYVVGQKVKNSGNIYICITAGTSAGSGGPSTTSSDITDNTAHWKYLFAQSMQAPKSINPAFPDFMSAKAWTNALERIEISPDNIVEVIVSLQQRRAMNGVQLGLATSGKVQIRVPYESYEQTREILEVFRQIPGTGVYGQAPTQVPIAGGSTSQVVFAQIDNPAFGRGEVIAVPGMKSTRWTVSAAPPNDMPPAHRSLFIHTQGGKAGEWKLQDDPASMAGDAVPHMGVLQFPAGTSSPMFTGAMEGTRAGDIGAGIMLAEGFATGCPILHTFCDTGYFS